MTEFESRKRNGMIGKFIQIWENGYLKVGAFGPTAERKRSPKEKRTEKENGGIAEERAYIRTRLIQMIFGRGPRRSSTTGLRLKYGWLLLRQSNIKFQVPHSLNNEFYSFRFDGEPITRLVHNLEISSKMTASSCFLSLPALGLRTPPKDDIKIFLYIQVRLELTLRNGPVPQGWRVLPLTFRKLG